MSILTAVETVLTEAGVPLHYKEITKRLLNQGLWATTGQTPDATVNAQLAVDIKRRGEASRFRRADKGVFALRARASTNPQPQPTPTPAPPTHLSFTDAAEKVLDKYADKSPMHYRAITDKALELGLIATAGKTPEQLKDSIIEKLSEFLNKPEVSVSVQAVMSRRYYITGEVGRSGAFPLVVPVTVLEALTNAGGFREFANTKKIRILRGTTTLKFNWKDVSHGKHMDQNIYLQNGDHIFVDE